MKKIKKIKVDYRFDWTYDISIDDILEDLEELKKLGATNIEIDPYIQNEMSHINYSAYFKREETDEEYQERIDYENKRLEEIRLRELEQLETLKKKYEL